VHPRLAGTSKHMYFNFSQKLVPFGVTGNTLLVAPGERASHSVAGFWSSAGYVKNENEVGARIVWP
jgi:hypothetical protein